jgi:hypothetical protein
MINHIASLWRGEVSLARVFWEYAIGWGTLINLLCTGAVLIVFLKDGPAWLGLLIHFAAIPYNIVMVVSVWRAAAHEHHKSFSSFVRLAIPAWFLIMLVI